MYQWQLFKWFQLMAVGAGLPFLAAGIIQTKSLVQDISSRASVAAAGPKVEFDGRDAFMSGEVASQEELETARNNVAAIYGVRRVDVANLKIVAPPPRPIPAPQPVIAAPIPLMAPTVKAMTSNNKMPSITGTYPVEATKLIVSVGTTTYTLGTSPELTADKSGNWILKPTAALPEGSVDVTAKVESADGSVTAASKAAAIVVDTVAPEAPSMVKAAADAVWPYVITGHWPEMPGNSLVLDFNSKSYALGKNKELISDGHGVFTFVPTDQLAPGKYDLNFSVTDAAGNVTKFSEAAAVTVAAPPAPLTAPTIDAVTSKTGNPVITGTWDSATSKGLTVTVAGISHELGKDADLTSDGNKWTLKTKSYLADGNYDVVATVRDSAGKTLSNVSAGEVIIKHPPPPPPPPPPKPLAPILTAPTVESLVSDNGNPTITGTWPAGAAKGLTVSLVGTTYFLGKDNNLLTDSSGKWTLKTHSYLADGKYDVVAVVNDGQGNTRSDATTGELIIKHPPPHLPPPTPPAPPPPLTAPTVTSLVSDNGNPTITGTWPAGVAKGLSISVVGTTYVLGKDYQLLTDSAGKWTLKTHGYLADGKYDVIATVNDGAGKTMTDATKGELVIKHPPPPPPAPPPKPPAPLPLKAPTVDKQVSKTGNPTLTGTWAAGIAKGLTVSLVGRTYVLGKDYDLLSDAAGKWTLKTHSYLGDGKYDVVATVNNGAGKTMSDATKGELIIKHPPPPPPPPPKPKPVLPAPTVETSTSDSDHPTIKGTWPAGIAKTLAVDLDGVTHKLGTNYDLLSDASGHWRLTPAKPVVNGVYDVVATVTDGDKQSVSDKTKGELTVNVAPPPPPPPPSKPYDCEATLARIAAVFPVRFDTDKWDLNAPFDLAVNQYSALLNDPRCAEMKMNIVGNADFRGTEAHNQGLSERRAKTVVDALTTAGLQLYRLNGIGRGEDEPLDPSTTEDALRKNRRVEFTVAK